MKTFFITIITLISFSIYSQNRYELKDEGTEKIYLSDTITKLATVNKIATNQPIVVIDGIPFRFQDLEKERLPLSKNEIISIIPIDKQKGINIFGTYGEAGVLIVTTNKKKK